MPRLSFLVVIAAALLPASDVLADSAAGEARVLRYPDISHTHIAFVLGGDLFTVGRDGG